MLILATFLNNPCFPREGQEVGKVGTSPYPSTWAPKPAKQVDVLFSASWERKGTGGGPRGSGGHIEAQRARKFSSVGSCFPPRDSQSYHVCDQQEDQTIPDPGDPQPPGPGRQGRGRDCWSHCYCISSRAVREGGMGKGRAGPDTMPRAVLRHRGRCVRTCDAPSDPHPSCSTDCSLGNPGHPQDVLELRRGQGRAKAAEGHCRPR